MRKSLKNISLLLLLSVYFVAANGMVLELAAQWYSSGAKAAVDLQSGAAKELPLPSLTQRTYTPPTTPTFVLSAGYVVSLIVFPTERPVRFLRFEEALPSYAAELFSTLSDRAPPAA